MQFPRDSALHGEHAWRRVGSQGPPQQRRWIPQGLSLDHEALAVDRLEECREVFRNHRRLVPEGHPRLLSGAHPPEGIQRTISLCR